METASQGDNSSQLINMLDETIVSSPDEIFERTNDKNP